MGSSKPRPQDEICAISPLLLPGPYLCCATSPPRIETHLKLPPSDNIQSRQLSNLNIFAGTVPYSFTVSRKTMGIPSGDDVVLIQQPKSSGDSTIVTVNCPDKAGLGCDLCRIILEFGLSITRAGSLSLSLQLSSCYFESILFLVFFFWRFCFL